MLEIHVDTPDGDHVRSARVELTYNGESNLANYDNDGNIGICLQNNSDEIVSFKKGERIMQGIFVKYAVCDSDDTNEVRKGGFGSTGKE